MRKISTLLLFISIPFISLGQTLEKSVDFSLGSPFNEPDGRKDIARVSATDIITLSKTKGNITGKSDFILERFDANLKTLWQTVLQAEVFEDYKELYYNGKEVVLLSVIHNEKDKKTTLEAYGFNIQTGAKLWTKELETYLVGEWENHPHKGKVKETFIDVVCEHVKSNFVTPIEYKHNINFSPNEDKFVSYVYNYGEKSLTASVCVYDKSCKLLAKGKVSIDDNYVNHGIYINNAGKIFILNSNNSGKLNIIKYDLQTKDFAFLDQSGSNFLKDDFQVQFLSDEILYVGCSEQMNGIMMGVMYSKFNFETNVLEKTVFESISGNSGMKIVETRKNTKNMKGEEDWKNYDITEFFVNENEEVTLVLEKRSLYADGYPHISRGVFDISHKVEISGHVQAEGIIIFQFKKDGDLKWLQYLPKNQIYAASDGLNSISYSFDKTDNAQYRFLYASSENLDSFMNSISFVSIDKASGKLLKDIKLPTGEKILFVREYTTWNNDNSVVIVGKKGVIGKSSSMLKFKF